MLRVVHDGVDPDRVGGGDRRRGRYSLGVGEDQLLLVTIAKLTDCKGHRFLLDALPAVIEKHPGLTVAFAGDGELREPLEQQARRLGVEQHVRFLGYRHDVPDLIQAADLYVHPSHQEGLCSTIIEAMLAGRTIVTTSAGGISDLVGGELVPSPLAPLPTNLRSVPGEGNRVAWTVPPCNSAALAEAILRALASPQTCATMQERARRRAEELFAAECMVEVTLAVYREVLAASGIAHSRGRLCHISERRSSPTAVAGPR
jgi:glycosyltransferase involved in cell wall biosynthesis